MDQPHLKFSLRRLGVLMTATDRAITAAAAPGVGLGFCLACTGEGNSQQGLSRRVGAKAPTLIPSPLQLDRPTMTAADTTTTGRERATCPSPLFRATRRSIELGTSGYEQGHVVLVSFFSLMSRRFYCFRVSPPCRFLMQPMLLPQPNCPPSTSCTQRVTMPA